MRLLKILTSAGIFLCGFTASYSQSVSPFITNVSGGSYHAAGSYTQYEWSVGELAAIETYRSNNIIITHGVLEPCTDKGSFPTTSLRFRNNEIRLFPNYTTGKFELDISVPLSGQLDLVLVNTTGQTIAKRSLHNECCGHIEYFDIGNLPSGIYLLTATLKADGTTLHGTIKVVKF